MTGTQTKSLEAGNDAEPQSNPALCLNYVAFSVFFFFLERKAEKPS